MTYRKDIQAFRAIAILLVMASHFQLPGFGSGFIGVDIFFVVSGYVITRLIDSEISTTGRFDYLNFYARRFNRLVPALLLMLSVILVLNYFINAPYDQLLQLPNAILASFWSSNLQLAFGEVDYFGIDTESNLFLHTWSLGVEEQFYIVWPGILVTAYLFTFRNRIIFFILIFILSLGTCIYFSFTTTAYAYYLMPMRIWQFLMGGLVFFIFEKQKHRYFNLSENLAKWVRIFGVLALVLAIYSIDANRAYPGFQVILPTVTTALLLVDRGQTSWDKKIYSSPILQWLGNRSYSLYLWHWPFWCFINSFPIKASVVKILSASVLTLFFASLSYRFLENPFRRSISLRWSSKKSIAVTFFILVVYMLLINFLFGRAERCPLPLS